VVLNVLKCFKRKLYRCICWLIFEVILRNARCNDESHSLPSLPNLTLSQITFLILMSVSPPSPPQPPMLPVKLRLRYAYSLLLNRQVVFYCPHFSLTTVLVVASGTNSLGRGTHLHYRDKCHRPCNTNTAIPTDTSTYP